MSEENVENAYRLVDALNRRDLDACLELMDENVESVSRIVSIEGGLWGHDGFRRWWDSWFSVFPDYKIEVQEVRDLGDVLLATVRAVGHGEGSELPVQDQIFHVSHWRDGRVVRWQVVQTEAEARVAAGLSE